MAYEIIWFCWVDGLIPVLGYNESFLYATYKDGIVRKLSLVKVISNLRLAKIVIDVIDVKVSSRKNLFTG